MLARVTIFIVAIGLMTIYAQPSFARWTPDPKRGSADSTLSGGRR